jgi:hypothetical protein
MIRTKNNTLPMPAMTIYHMVWFWKRIERKGEEDCWPWIGATSSFGHGRVKFRGKLYSSHRLAYHLGCGKLPERGADRNALVMHTCDNPRCCNPDHLKLGTPRDNARDMVSKGRHHEQVRKLKAEACARPAA